MSNIESMMNDWLRRQRAAFDASSRSVRKICDSRDIIDVAQAQNEWVSDCLEWTASQLRAAGNENNLDMDRTVDADRGTAYRIRTGDLRLERAVSWASRRMRRRWSRWRPDRDDTAAPRSSPTGERPCGT